MVRYTSVTEMVRAMGDKKFADEFEDLLRRRQTVKKLTLERVKAGLSQEELEHRAGFPAGKVAEIESGEDVDLSPEDYDIYMRALTKT